MRPSLERPTNTAALSLLELRRHLLKQAGMLAARARELREKGSNARAARMAEESARLRSVAHEMGNSSLPRE